MDRNAPLSESWRILFVEDDEDDYWITREMLSMSRGRKFELEWVSTYRDGQERLQAGSYDAVLVDYDLGARTGIQFIREAAARGCPAPLILFTGRGSYEADMEAMQAGASLYLAKSDVDSLTLERFIRYAIERKRIEQQFDRQLQQQSTILESIQDGLFGVDRAWRITYINTRAARNVGSQPQALSGRNIWEVFPRLLGTDMERNFRQVMETRAPAQFETRGVYQDLWFSVSVYPSAEGISVYWQDVTPSKRAAEALHASEERFIRAFNATPAALIILRREDGLIQQVNDSFERLFGCASDAVLGKSVFELNLYPNSAERDRLTSALEQGQPVRNLDLDVCNNTGQVRHARLTIEWLRIAAEDCALVIVEDITERQNAEQAIQNERNRLLAVLAALPIGMAIYNEQGGVIQSNQAFEAVWGSPRPPADSIDDYDAYQAWWAETGQRVQPEQWAAARAVQNGETVAGQFIRIQRFDGTFGYVLNSGAPVTNSSGQVTGAAVAIMDITGLIEAQAALHEAEERFRVALLAVPLLVYTCDVQQRYTWVYNPQRGFRVEDVLGKRDDELLPPGAAAELVAAKQQALDSGQGRVCEVRVPFGDKIAYYVLTTEPVKDAAGQVSGLICSAIDITEQRQLEMEEREQALQNELRRRLLENREKERQSIALDLHDGPVQDLSSLLFRVQFARSAFKDPAMLAELDNIAQVLKNAVQNLRGMINEMRPPSLIRFGLARALRTYMEDLQEKHPDLNLSFSLTDEQGVLTEQARLNLYRIAQEALTNAIKHASATHIDVLFEAPPGQALLTITDNGAGFNPSADLFEYTQRGHYGLAGMRERAESIGGLLEIQTSAGNGTSVEVRLPLK